MKLGVFDSGLGGLIIAKAIHDHMPDLDMVYLGDTLRLPYGNRSDDAIYRFTKRGIDFLFEQDCSLIIIACNTASAKALRRLQQTYLADAWPGRNVLGVVVPTLEAALDQGFENLGLIGTNATVRSGVYHEELTKFSPDIKITEQATPLLVPLIENGGDQWLEDVLEHYLAPLKNSGVECVLLGCTHYATLKDQITALLGQGVKLLSQDEIIPAKLEAYIANHPEYVISRGGSISFFVSDLTDSYKASAARLYGQEIDIQKVDL